MKKVLRIIGWILLIALFVGTIVFLVNKSADKPVVFEIKQPQKITITKKTIATGSVVPRQEINIKPQVSGIIDKLYLEAGEEVEKNAIIAGVKIIPDMNNLNAAESRVRQAKLNLKNEKRNYDRQKELLGKAVISSSEFETAELSYNSAKEDDSPYPIAVD